MKKYKARIITAAQAKNPKLPRHGKWHEVEAESEEDAVSELIEMKKKRKAIGFGLFK